MNDKNIQSYQALRRENIDLTNYTTSLILEGCRVGLLTEDNAADIRIRFMEQLSKVIMMYTKGEASSVRTEIGQILMKSLFYNIDTFLLSLNDERKALAMLAMRNYEEIYGRGYLINREYFEKAKMLYTKARYTRSANGSADYNKLLDKYLYNYLKMYNPKFNAHDRLYVNLPEIGFKGGFHINRVVELLEAIIKLNQGKQSDIIL